MLFPRPVDENGVGKGKGGGGEKGKKCCAEINIASDQRTTLWPGSNLQGERGGRREKKKKEEKKKHEVHESHEHERLPPMRQKKRRGGGRRVKGGITRDGIPGVAIGVLFTQKGKEKKGRRLSTADVFY